MNCSNCDNPIATPLSTTNYCVIGSNEYNCKDTACLTILVDDNCGEIFIPSAFSPNNDGNNDTWFVHGRCIKNIEVKVFNRWGEKVFESFDKSKSWDGTFRGKNLDTDVFVYIVNIRFIDNSKKEFHGNITLIR